MGVHHIYARSVFKSAFQAPRAACLVAWQGLEKIPSLPRQAAAPQTDWPRPFAAAFGYPEIGPRCIRVDLVEKITALLRKRAKTGPSALPSAPAKWLGCPVSVWEEIAAELGDGRSRKGRRSD
jgi:hypothetical protein